MGFRELDSSCTSKVLRDWEGEDLQPLWAPGSFLESERIVYAPSSSHLCAKPHPLCQASPPTGNPSFQSSLTGLSLFCMVNNRV